MVTLFQANTNKNNIMETRFFITEIYVPAGAKNMEIALAKLAGKYVDCILSYDAMLRFADQIAREHEHLLKENRKMKPVPISVDLEGDDSLRGERWRHFYIGQVSVRFRVIKGEII